MGETTNAAASSADDARLLLLSPQDNVLVAREVIASGTEVQIRGVQVTLAIEVQRGHKVARGAIEAGDRILKYGAPIGVATQAITTGDHVHVHNIRSNYTATHLIERTKPATVPGESAP